MDEGYALVKVIVGLVIGLGVVVGAVGNALFGAKAQARKRLKAGAKELVDGAIVTLTGKVRAIKTLESPVAGTECVAYHVHLTTYSVFANRKSLAEEMDVVEMTPFELEVDGKIVIVDDDKAEIAIDTAPVIPRKLARERALLTRIGLDASDARAGNFVEAVVTNGQRVQVQGLIVREVVQPSEKNGYREAAERVRLVAQPMHLITIGSA